MVVRGIRSVAYLSRKYWPRKYWPQKYWLVGATSLALLNPLVVWGRVSTSVETASKPDVRSHAAVVMDADKAEILFARNPNARGSIASITKLMTALVVLDANQSLGDIITITAEDRRGTPSRLQVGAKLSRGDLLRLALMSSENCAAHALGREYPGGVAGLVQAMNAKARSLGMSESRFADASGLSANNVATASDLVQLVLAAARYPQIRQFSTTSHYSVAVSRRMVDFRTTNYLVGKADWDIELQKTGYTNEAGQCLVMKTNIDGRSVVIVLLDSFGKYTRTADARRIRKWLESTRVSIVAR